MGGANKGELSRTDESKVDKTNIKVGVRVGKANKGDVSGANIKVGKKADARVITSTNNNTDGGSKATDKYAGLADLAIAILATADCADNSIFAVPEETPSGAITSTSDEFLAIFAVFANTILERESKMYKSNLFLFAANHQ